MDSERPLHIGPWRVGSNGPFQTREELNTRRWDTGSTHRRLSARRLVREREREAVVFRSRRAPSNRFRTSWSRSLRQCIAESAAIAVKGDAFAAPPSGASAAAAAPG
jgi:hypothetical protein